MATFKDFRQITAWQLAHQMSLRVEVFLACPDFRRHFASCDQLRNAARSAPRYIAEGHERLKHREFAGFVRTAKAVERDVLAHLVAAHAQLLITTDELIINRQLAKRAIRAAGSLIRYLESTPEVARHERNAKARRGAEQSPEIRIHPPGPSGSELHDEQRHHADADRR